MPGKKVLKAIFNNLESLTQEQIVSIAPLKELMRTQIPLAIEDAHKNKKIFASIFEINSSGLFVELHKKDWEQALETCIMWEIEHQNFEECNRIKKLIETIKEKRSIKLKVKQPTDAK